MARSRVNRLPEHQKTDLQRPPSIGAPLKYKNFILLLLFSSLSLWRFPEEGFLFGAISVR